MDQGTLKLFGQVAGLAGLSLGVVLILFREVIRKNIFPGLTREHGYRLLRLIVILAWSVAIIGIGAWTYSNAHAQPNPASQGSSSIQQAAPDQHPSEQQPTPTETISRPHTMQTNAQAAHFLEVIALRIADISKATGNLRDLLKEIRAGKVDQSGPLNRINDLNNGLFDLWLQIAGYGLGTDPYQQNIARICLGILSGQTSPDYGDTDVPTAMGVPRLYSRYLELTEQNDSTRRQKREELLSHVQFYGNPAIYPLRDFYERAYSSYREGKGLNSAQFQDDLVVVDAWLSKLDAELGEVQKMVNR